MLCKALFRAVGELVDQQGIITPNVSRIAILKLPMKKNTLILLTILLSMWFGLESFRIPVFAQADQPQVLLLEIDGPLTPSWVEYLERGLETAENRGADFLIFQINTPGGSTDIMQSLVEMMRGSAIPIVVYVAPQGAIAGSAGTVITLAGHAAAMAPQTIIGAASPVGAQGEDLDETIETKLKEAIKAQVRTLASDRPQEAIELAEATIEDAKAVSAEEAFDIGLIDILADDIPDLLGQLDGFQVETSAGEIMLNTDNAEVIPLGQSFIEEILSILTNPNIVFLLLSIGVQALLIELSSPGGWVAGFIGVVSLALAAYGLGVLPVNWFGLIFLGTAFVLFVLELKAATPGALTAAGVVSLIIGALILFNSPATPEFQRVSVPLVVVTSGITGGVFAVAMIFAIRAQQTPIRMGQESLVGRFGTVKTEIPVIGVGQVQLASELWTAEQVDGVATIPRGARVEVVEVKGIRLKVRSVQ
jgi:membrane-bound serine protease (ClpP class)